MVSSHEGGRQKVGYVRPPSLRRFPVPGWRRGSNQKPSTVSDNAECTPPVGGGGGGVAAQYVASGWMLAEHAVWERVAAATPWSWVRRAGYRIPITRDGLLPRDGAQMTEAINANPSRRTAQWRWLAARRRCRRLVPPNWKSCTAALCLQAQMSHVPSSRRTNLRGDLSGS